MNLSMSVIETSGSCPDDLIKAMNDNCKAAENLAIETIISSDAPLVNAFRELTRGDCWQIMRKQQEVFNVLEQAIVLSSLTDYVTCAYQNELFDTFRKKQDRDHFSTLLVHLNSKWTRFFHKLGRYDLSYTQLNSIMFLLRQSLKRLPANYSMLYMRESLLMGENSLERAQPLFHNDVAEFAEPKDKLDSTVSKSNGHHKISVKSANEIAVRNSKSSPCNIETLQKSNENKIKISANKFTPGNSKTSDLQKRTLDFNKPPMVDLTSEPAMKIQRKKYNADITRYILKSSENKDKEPFTANVSISEIKGKENFNQESSSSTGIQLNTELKNPVTHTTPTGKLNSVTCAESPSKKKSQIEDKTAGNKVNAFEVMMRCSRAIKGQTIKRKSLFQ